MNKKICLFSLALIQLNAVQSEFNYEKPQKPASKEPEFFVKCLVSLDAQGHNGKLTPENCSVTIKHAGKTLDVVPKESNDFLRMIWPFLHKYEVKPVITSKWTLPFGSILPKHVIDYTLEYGPIKVPDILSK